MFATADTAHQYLTPEVDEVAAAEEGALLLSNCAGVNAGPPVSFKPPRDTLWRLSPDPV